MVRPSVVINYENKNARKYDACGRKTFFLSSFHYMVSHKNVARLGSSKMNFISARHLFTSGPDFIPDSFPLDKNFFPSTMRNA